MTDRFSSHATSLESPAMHGFTISPDDSLPLEETTRAIYVGTAGNIALTLGSGSSIVFTNVPAGTILPVRTEKISATGTTASGMVGLV